MSAVVYCSGDPDEKYFELIEGSSPAVIVLGESQEQWTTLTLDFFSNNNISAFFLPWNKMQEVRVQSDFHKYPVVQFWRNKTCLAEVIGYREHDLAKVVKLFHKR